MGVHILSRTWPVVRRTFVLSVQIVVAEDSFSTKPADVFLLQTTQRGPPALMERWKTKHISVYFCVHVLVFVRNGSALTHCILLLISSRAVY